MLKGVLPGGLRGYNPGLTQPGVGVNPGLTRGYYPECKMGERLEVEKIQEKNCPPRDIFFFLGVKETGVRNGSRSRDMLHTTRLDGNRSRDRSRTPPSPPA